MSTRPLETWPPIISDARLPRSIVLRNAVLTALAWAGFAYAFAVNFEVGWHSLRMNRGLVIIVTLVFVLGVATLASRRRRKRALLGSQPGPARDLELAADLGLDEPGLHALRERRIVVVDIGPDGKLIRRPGPGIPRPLPP